MPRTEAPPENGGNTVPPAGQQRLFLALECNSPGSPPRKGGILSRCPGLLPATIPDLLREVQQSCYNGNTSAYCLSHSWGHLVSRTRATSHEFFMPASSARLGGPAHANQAPAGAVSTKRYAVGKVQGAPPTRGCYVTIPAP
jgi:hypothetical protein